MLAFTLVDNALVPVAVIAACACYVVDFLAGRMPRRTKPD